MAEEADEITKTSPKKAPRKRSRTPKPPKTETSVSKSAATTSAPAGNKTAQKEDARSKPEHSESEDLWDQTAETLSKVDWGQRGRHLFRLVLMLFAGIAAELSVFVIYFLTAVHFLYTLVTGQKLVELTAVCGRFTAYIKQLLDFISYRSDEPLFPFAPFPEAEDAE